MRELKEVTWAAALIAWCVEELCLRSVLVVYKIGYPNWLLIFDNLGYSIL